MSSPLSPSASSPLNPPADSDEDSDNGKSKSVNQPQQPQRQRDRGVLRSACPPPSFHAAVPIPGGGSATATRPYYLFPLFVLINVATMTDRSIIAGASQEFSAFVSGAADAPSLVRENPDAGIGLLQVRWRRCGGCPISCVRYKHLWTFHRCTICTTASSYT